MCKVIELLHGCGHPHSYPLIEECYAGFFPSGILCGAQNTEIANSLTLAEYPYCIDYCFKRMKLEIEIDYLLNSAKLVEDARQVGWTEADIQGSHLDLEKEFEQELNCLIEVCNVPKQMPKLEPKSAVLVELYGSGGLSSNPEPGSPEEGRLESEQPDESPIPKQSQRQNHCGNNPGDGHHGNCDMKRPNHYHPQTPRTGVLRGGLTQSWRSS